MSGEHEKRAIADELRLNSLVLFVNQWGELPWELMPKSAVRAATFLGLTPDDFPTQLTVRFDDDPEDMTVPAGGEPSVLRSALRFAFPRVPLSAEVVEDDVTDKLK